MRIMIIYDWNWKLNPWGNLSSLIWPLGKALTGTGVVGAPGRGAGVVVKIRWANRPARSPAFSMGCNINSDNIWITQSKKYT